MSLTKLKEQFNVSDLGTMDIDQILDLSKSIETLGLEAEELHEWYFSEAVIEGTSSVNGVIATPVYIAEYIVGEAVISLSRPLSDITWLDPCCGSGIFVEAILDKYFQETGSACICELPEITAVDISPLGVLITLLVVRVTLDRYGHNFEDYLSSEKMKVHCCNSLALYEEDLSLLTLPTRSFTAVVGNPPYVRSTRMSMKQKMYLKQEFPCTYSGNSDLFYYFISSAISTVQREGIVGFISPANFFRAKSAFNLRQIIETKASLIKLIDLDELPVFPDADIHTTIYLLKNQDTKNPTFEYAHLTKTGDLTKLSDGNLQFSEMSSSGINRDGWVFSDRNDTFSVSAAHTLTLKDAGIKIYSGIRPGIKEAFVRTPSEVSFLTSDLLEKWFKPCLDAKSIVKWAGSDVHLSLLFIPNRTERIPFEVEDLLHPFKEKLLGRPEAKNNGNWFSLRPCSYYSLFNNDKILFPDISSSSRFSLDNSGSFVLDGSFFIDSDSLALLGVLNSDLAWKYFVAHCSSIGNAKNKGRVRLKKNHVENFPIPRALLDHSNKSYELEKIVCKIIRKGESVQLMETMNRLVEELYLERP